MTSEQETGDPLAQTRGRTGWIISDGKAGNDAQARGVCVALGLDYQIKPIAPGPIQRLISPHGGVSRRERFGMPGSRFAPPWPDFAIATGRLTTPYIRAIRRAARMRTFTIILLDPKVSLKTADLFWIPEHDRRRGPNVVTTVTAPHDYAPERLEKLREAGPPAAFGHLPHPWIAVVLGGSNDVYRYTAEDEARLSGLLAAIAADGATLVVTPSRRTQPSLLAAVRAAVADRPHFIWDGTGDNPYPAMLALADRFIVTADSVNMCGEVAVSGRPVHVFHPAGGSAKFTRFHDALRSHGATRPLEHPDDVLEPWTYPPLFSARTIAREIATRWSRRQRILPGLAGSRPRDGG